jgi:hypothetical protein
VKIHIDQTFPAETPVALGLHPNAAIQTASEASDKLMTLLLELQPHAWPAGWLAAVEVSAIAMAGLTALAALASGTCTPDAKPEAVEPCSEIL